MSGLSIFFVLLAICFGGVGIYGVAVGTMPMKYVDIDRVKSPISFWMAAAAYGLICLGCIWGAFSGE